jgi:cell division protein ZapE
MLLNAQQQKLLDTLNRIYKAYLEHKKFSLFKTQRENLAGVYIQGSVGCGKTTVMKLFYDQTAQNCNQKNKKFIHYQQLIKLIHQNNINSNNQSDYISTFAKNYFKNIQILCIDEIEIKDPADAVIIYHLLAALTKNKVFIVFSSNFHPNDFKINILNTELIEPLISFFTQSFEIFSLNSNIDYRTQSTPSVTKKILFPNNDINKQEFLRITNELTAPYQKKTIELENFGRKIIFQNTYSSAYGAILLTDFAEICTQKLSYSDYISICEHFDAIIIQDIPIISSNETDFIIRFINLIDSIYFYKVLLFALLPDSPKKIYTKGIKIAEFNRTISRLIEIDSVSYASASKFKYLE